jgi:hypothetical protein
MLLTFYLLPAREASKRINERQHINRLRRVKVDLAADCPTMAGAVMD